MPHRRHIIALVGLLIVASIGSVTHVAAADERCFPQTGKCISGAIRAYWERNGGLAVFGFPITHVTDEDNGEGFRGPTQWFERDRLEDQGAAGVLAGRLGARKLSVEGRPWEGLPTATGAPAGCRFFAETNHSLCQPFLAYWERNGGLERFGYPISEPGDEQVGAWRGTVQWFERRRMEAHPENQQPYDVLLGLLGNELSANQATPAPPSAPAPAPDDIVGRLVAQTNMYRAQAGCPSVTLNDQLSVAAQSHSQDMAQNDFFSHTGSDGSSLSERLHRAGYRFSAAAENLAAGTTTPERTVDGWVNETPPNDGHRRNILNCELREIGVGYVYLANDTGNVNYNYYWTQDFGTR